MLRYPLKQLRWKSWIKPWLRLDWLLFTLVLALTGLGGLLIRSTELHQGLTDWKQHWLIGAIGLGLALILSRIRYDLLLPLRWGIYGLTNLSLIVVMVAGTKALGAQRWITIGGFNVQPSEFAKVGLIITLAATLHFQPADKLWAVFKTLAIASLPWMLVFLQPDLGTSLVFGAITLGMLYWANANPGWIILMISPLVSMILFGLSLPFHLSWVIGSLWVLGMGIIGWRTIPQPILGAITGLGINLGAAAAGQILWGLLKDYQKDRLVLFLDPDKDPLGGGYHLIQSRIAIGSGGLWGTGLNEGTQTQLNFIPEQHTDFIFSAIGEELGFIGSLLIILVFWLICLRLILIARTARDNFGGLLAAGVLSMLIFQVIVNVGMTIGLAPVTGIPLPWLSYGRSALLTNFIAIGLVESVANYRLRRQPWRS